MDPALKMSSPALDTENGDYAGDLETFSQV
jgi:hypothetical protein